MEQQELLPKLASLIFWKEESGFDIFFGIQIISVYMIMIPWKISSKLR